MGINPHDARVPHKAVPQANKMRMADPFAGEIPS
jgi:hypothetical protein